MTTSAASRVRRASAAAMRFGDGIEPVAVRMVLVDADAVEAELGRELELVEEVVVHDVRACRVEQARVDVDPDRRMLRL